MTELEIFLLSTASSPALGPIQPPIQWVPGALSLGVKRPGLEADQSPPSSAFTLNTAIWVAVLYFQHYTVPCQVRY